MSVPVDVATAMQLVGAFSGIGGAVQIDAVHAGLQNRLPYPIEHQVLVESVVAYPPGMLRKAGLLFQKVPRRGEVTSGSVGQEPRFVPIGREFAVEEPDGIREGQDALFVRFGHEALDAVGILGARQRRIAKGLAVAPDDEASHAGIGIVVEDGLATALVNGAGHFSAVGADVHATLHPGGLRHRTDGRGRQRKLVFQGVVGLQSDFRVNGMHFKDHRGAVGGDLQLQGLGIVHREPVLVRVRQIADSPFLVAHEEHWYEVEGLVLLDGGLFVKRLQGRLDVFPAQRKNEVQTVHREVASGSQLHLDAVEAVILDGMPSRQFHVVVFSRLQQFHHGRRVLEDLQLAGNEADIVSSIKGQAIFRRSGGKHRAGVEFARQRFVPEGVCAVPYRDLGLVAILADFHGRPRRQNLVRDAEVIQEQLFVLHYSDLERSGLAEEHLAVGVKDADFHVVAAGHHCSGVQFVGHAEPFVGNLLVQKLFFPGCRAVHQQFQHFCGTRDILAGENPGKPSHQVGVLEGEGPVALSASFVIYAGKRQNLTVAQGAVVERQFIEFAQEGACKPSPQLDFGQADILVGHDVDAILTPHAFAIAVGEHRAVGHHEDKGMQLSVRDVRHGERVCGAAVSDIEGELVSVVEEERVVSVSPQFVHRAENQRRKGPHLFPPLRLNAHLEIDGQPSRHFESGGVLRHNPSVLSIEEQAVLVAPACRDEGTTQTPLVTVAGKVLQRAVRIVGREIIEELWHGTGKRV